MELDRILRDIEGGDTGAPARLIIWLRRRGVDAIMGTSDRIRLFNVVMGMQTPGREQDLSRRIARVLLEEAIENQDQDEALVLLHAWAGPMTQNMVPWAHLIGDARQEALKVRALALQVEQMRQRMIEAELFNDPDDMDGWWADLLSDGSLVEYTGSNSLVQDIPSRALALPMEDRWRLLLDPRLVGTVGDWQQPFEGGGGAVVQHEDGLFLEYWRPTPDYVLNTKLHTHRTMLIHIPENIEEDWDWIGLEGFATYQGMTVDQVLDWMRNDEPISRGDFVYQLARYEDLSDLEGLNDRRGYQLSVMYGL